LYGVMLIDGKTVLASRKPFKTFFVAGDAYQLLDKWLYLYLLNAELPAKYLPGFRLIVSGNIKNLAKHFAEIFGSRKGKTIIATISEHGFEALPKIGRYERLRILFRTVLRDPLFHLWHVPLFLYYRLKCHLFPCGEFVALSGPDGSGKTTVLELVREKLSTAFGLQEKSIFHFRPSVLPRIAELARTVNLISSVDHNYSEPHRAKPSGIFGSSFRVAYYALDYFAGYFKVIRPILFRRELVISDRYFYDLIADPGRSRISLPFGLLNAIFRFMPKPHTAFFILASPERIRERKQELAADTIEALNRRYIELAKRHRNLVIIDNNGGPEKAAADIVDAVITRRAQRLGLMKPEAGPPVTDVSNNKKSVS
jgi:thymidylate kinase